MRKQFEQTYSLKNELLLNEKRQDFQRYRLKVDDVHLDERQRRVKEIRNKSTLQRQNFERARSRSNVTTQIRRQQALEYEQQMRDALSALYQNEYQREKDLELRELQTQPSP